MKGLISIKIILVFILFYFLPFFLLGQQVTKFTYGGNKGTRHNGTFNIEYFIENNGRKSKIDNESDKIDLNSYRDDVSILLEISELKLGLNKRYDKIKNNDHSKVFYLKIVNLSNKNDTIKVSAKGAHYGKEVNQIQFLLGDLTEITSTTLESKILIVDGIYDRKWQGPKITKKFAFIPREKEVLTTDTTKQNFERSKKYNKTSNNKVKNPITSIEERQWDKIQQSLANNDVNKFIEYSKNYRDNCEKSIFTECAHMEEILFFMIQKSTNELEKETLIKEYKEQYPSGRYLNDIETTTTESANSIIPPVVLGVAKMDFNEEVVLINRVNGGSRPYYVDFFDAHKSKEYAIKRIRFNEDNFIVDLKTIKIPVGTYTVKVTDSRGQLFVSKDNVSIVGNYDIPKSIKIIILLIGLGVLFFLYKRFVYF